MLQDKNIVMGVTGGIAAYKAVEVVSRLRKAGASVHVIMTREAAKFVTPLTFREISNNPVVVDMWDEPKQWNVEHIALANLADLFLIAPATANIIGKIASGIADDMLSTTVMATKAPVFLCPAMNTNMFTNPIVQQNLNKLTGLGYKIMPPAVGMLACGTEGPGRLPEPLDIVQEVSQYFNKKLDLSGKTIIVTAAGTHEPIDPVRFVGNSSSGKMGYAVAEAAAARGAKVILVSGPCALTIPNKVGTVRKVTTTKQMRDAVFEYYPQADVVIKAAAVADYRPKVVSDQKIKKNDDTLTLVLEKNPDILKELGAQKQNQILVGFAAETQELLANAKQKLVKKNLDMIVANDVTMAGAGFNADTNIVKLLYPNGNAEELPIMSKREVADIILDRVQEIILRKSL